MRKLYLPLSLTALGVLAACASSDPVTPAPTAVIVQPAPVVTAPPPPMVVQQPATVVTTTSAIRAGHGRIESITPLPQSAATGGTVKQLKRVGIKMDDGTVQFVDTPAENLSIGERAELTSDGQLKR